MEQAMAERGGGGGGRIVSLIEKATNSTAREVDPRLLKAIKYCVRYSDQELRLAAQTLTDLMKRDHSQVRYLALLVIDELFMRSKLFRILIVENLDQLLSLSVGFRSKLPLPDPPAIATLLRSKAIEFLEKWNSSFGIHYKKLRLGFDYLKNTLKFQFPNLQENAARIQRERHEREMRTREILRNKFESLRENFSSIKDEIDETIKEIKECLEIVQSKGDDDVPLALLDQEEFEEFRSSQLRQIRLDSLKESENVQETSENGVIFDTLRELWKLLVTKHLVSVQEWISILIRVEVDDNRMRDNMLKEFIDIRNNILAMKKRYEEAGFAVSKTKDHGKDVMIEEEDIWEEQAEGNEETPVEQNLEPEVRTPVEQNLEPEVRTSVSESKFGKNLDRKDKLLAEAPVVKWGSQLSSWESNTEVLANHRGLEIENHWGRVDEDAVIPPEKIAELNLQATIYEEEREEIRPCRAPLRKGGLCERRDLRVCPFHGLIVPRDDEGKPVTKEPPLMDTESDQLARKAVKNVRVREKEDEMKKRANRAKLAKVRQHNERVLRDAALASTSRSAVIDDEEEFDRLVASRKKQETLSSMLRKKVTSKDRLAERLLKTRAKGAAARQIHDEKFRDDSSANQW